MGGCRNPQRRLEVSRSPGTLEERAEDVMHESPMGYMVSLKLCERARPISSVIAHTDRAPFEFVLLIRERMRL